MRATSYFDQDNARAEPEFLKDQVIVTKDNCDKKGSMEYFQNHSMATTALNSKFGVAKHIDPMSYEGEAKSGNTNYKSIQEMLCGNNDKIKSFKECCDKYDMTEVLIIPRKGDTKSDTGT